MTPATRTRSPSPPRVDPYHDQGKLLALQVMLAARLDELLAALGVKLYRARRMYTGPCPIHGGDNHGAINLYHDGDTCPGFWRCNTRGCDRVFKRTIIGFVRGVLSNRKLDWAWLDNVAERERQKTVRWNEAVDWCCAFLGTSIEAITVDHAEMEKRRFAADVANLTRVPQQTGGGLTRAVVRSHLKIPADYFVARGFSAEVLDKYDVGFYPAVTDEQGRTRPLAHRVAVPVYDDDYKWVVGFTGRSVFEKCPRCTRHHPPTCACPAKGDGMAWGRTAKWFNHNFAKDSYLFNYWFARKCIKDTNTVVLVEGPGDVLRLEESDIHCGVALFGTQLSDEQQVLLEKSGAMNVVVLTDTDAAGEMGRDELKKRLGRSFRLHFPVMPTKDIGEMRPEQVKRELGPLLARLAERGY